MNKLLTFPAEFVRGERNCMDCWLRWCWY